MSAARTSGNSSTPAATAGHGVLSSGTTLPLDSRGRLRNGARSGDFLAAPRCGARTRCGGSCRQPAMKNGRCRLHGGLSTGPRTPEGRARCAAARTIHGGYNAETVKLMRDAVAAARRFRVLVARLPRRPTAGHGVLPQEPVGAAPCGRPRANATTPQPKSTASQRLCAKPSARPRAPTAGHGVLSFKPSLVQRALLGTTALGISVRLPVAVAPTAGHGVLSPAWPAAVRIA